MNAMPESIIVNSCQYTPVYLIQDPGATQGQSYFIAQSSVEEAKPISDNLKSFYESSGNIENGFVNVNSGTKPRILKKHDSSVVGNNLKLASFLLPKTENAPKQHYVVNNVILKPNVTPPHSSFNGPIITNTVNTNNVTNTITTSSTVNTVPRLNIDSKIVKLKDTTFNGTKTRYSRVEKASPKIIKPKELPPILQSTPSKHTSVQLLKLGETYHSLNQLSDEQMKMVSQALKMFGNPQTVTPEPAYDPVTNTKFFYKVVSPRDLTVVGKNKIIRKEKKDIPVEAIIKTDIKKELVKSEAKKEIKKESSAREIKKENKDNVKELKKGDTKHFIRKNEQKLLKQRILRELMEQDDMEFELRQQVTRSGRKVKLPKLSFPEGSTTKPKKKNTSLSCFQCCSDFPSLYRLQKHYQSHPTHIPEKIHSNLFHCLLAIVKSGSEEDQTNIFVQQLEQLIVKLKSLLPCLLKSSENEGKTCTISEDVSRLLGMTPGKYNLDMEALDCVKNKDGFCDHSPPNILSASSDIQHQDNGNQSWITMNNEVILANTEAETEDCARVNSVEKWPTVSKRVWKQKQQRSEENAKRMRLASENCDTFIELEMDAAVTPGPCIFAEEKSAIITNEQGAEQKSDGVVIKIEFDDDIPEDICTNKVEDVPAVNMKTDVNFSKQHQPVETEPPKAPSKSNHGQFYSAHFDIRSSPIKPSSTTFRKFQINPELLAKYEAQIIRSIETVDKDHVSSSKISCPTVEEVLRTSENVLETSAQVLNEENMKISAAMETDQKILNTCPNVLIDANSLQSSQDILHTNSDIRRNTDVLADEDTLQEIFRDEDLSAVKESFILDKELKDWILNRSNDEKSEDGFSRSTAVIEPALLHVKDDEIKSGVETKHELTSDNHDESSVLNFLDTLATDCLAYPGTEIRTNNGDFQLDLFSFHSS